MMKDREVREVVVSLGCNVRMVHVACVLRDLRAHEAEHAVIVQRREIQPLHNGRVCWINRTETSYQKGIKARSESFLFETCSKRRVSINLSLPGLTESDFIILDYNLNIYYIGEFLNFINEKDVRTLQVLGIRIFQIYIQLNAFSDFQKYPACRK